MKYKPNRDLPRFVRENKTFSPTKLREVILRERNKAVTPESISNWFRRHPQIEEELRKEVVSEELPKEEVSETIFQNGTFEELASVKNWINEMKDRDLAQTYISRCVADLKRVCMAMFPLWNVDLVKEGLWAFRHPDRLSMDEVREIIRTLKDRGFDTASIRISLRGFLTSKGIAVGKKIIGGKPKGYGKYADLFVERYTLDKMLAWIYGLNHEAYVCDKFMFKTASRISATLNSSVRNLVDFGDHAELKVFDKGRRSIYPEGKPWIKLLDSEFYIREFKPFIEGKSDLIFQISKVEMAKINRTAIEKFCPWILEKYKDVMPNHFWRHMFAQHMLRLTGWNYAVVAYLGGWDVKSLQESYGKPPEEKVKEWGLMELPKL